jgi:hypothetical protein
VFTSPYSGLAQVIKPDGLYTSQQRFGLYRWHIAEPVQYLRYLQENPQQRWASLEQTWRKCLQRKSRSLCMNFKSIRSSSKCRTTQIALWEWDLTTNEVYFSPEYRRQLSAGEAELTNGW